MAPFQHMNLFQNANVAARFLIFAALVVGIVEAVNIYVDDELVLPNQSLSITLICVFIIIFNIKASLDDHHYFDESWENHIILRYVGFVLAVFSWIFLGVSAALVHYPVSSVMMLGLSLLVSTAWVAVHLIEITIDSDRRNREVIISLMREKWLIINVLYLICIMMYLGWLDPVVPPYQWWSMAILLLVLSYDMFTSRPIIKIGKPT